MHQKGEVRHKIWRVVGEHRQVTIDRPAQIKHNVKITLHLNRLRDPDGLAGCVKPILDAMCRWSREKKSGGIGLIYDDGPEYIDLVVTQEKCQKKDQRTIIELDEEQR